MANSSDWVALLAGDAPQPEEEAGSQPGWMAALQGAASFNEGAPFTGGASQREVPPSEAPASPADPEPLEPEVDLIADAYARGHAEGHAQGVAETTAKQAEQQEHMRALRLNFRAFDQAASDAFAQELADTVVTLCEGALAGFASDPENLVSRCKEAAARLGTAASECKLHLNPEDLAAIDKDALEGWDVVGDPSGARAGLRFEGPDGLVSDGPEEWRRAIAAAIQG